MQRLAAAAHLFMQLIHLNGKHLAGSLCDRIAWEPRHRHDGPAIGAHVAAVRVPA
jgi:hypothetical protein